MTAALRPFVLVHGAWHGAWCWEAVAERLRAQGHRVTTPTQTGVGERADELSIDITVTTFVDDVVQHLQAHDLTDVILVGHSFGGVSILGAADRVPERIARLVLLDAIILDDGETWFEQLPAQVAAARRAAADGPALPPPPPESLGVTDERLAALLRAKLTPHPVRTFDTPLQLAHPLANGVPVDSIRCSDPAYAPLVRCHERARGLGWPITELAAGHDAMLTHPRETAELLARLAR